MGVETSIFKMWSVLGRYAKITKHQQTWVFGNLSLTHSCLDLAVPISKAVPILSVKPRNVWGCGRQAKFGNPQELVSCINFIN